MLEALAPPVPDLDSCYNCGPHASVQYELIKQDTTHLQTCHYMIKIRWDQSDNQNQNENGEQLGLKIYQKIKIKIHDCECV